MRATEWPSGRDSERMRGKMDSACARHVKAALLSTTECLRSRVLPLWDQVVMTARRSRKERRSCCRAT